VAGAAAVAGASASAGGVAAGRAVARLGSRVGARLTSARDRGHRSLAWMNARQQDTRWAVEYAMPWVQRRLRHQSSGDDVLPKFPDLLPLDALTGFTPGESCEST
jgi:hypothetical protein